MHRQSATPFDMSDITVQSAPRGEKRKLRRSQRIEYAAKRQKVASAPSYKIKLNDGQKASAAVQVVELATPPPSIPPTPKTQRALTIARKGEYEVVNDFPITALQNEDEVMIRSHSVGLNPIDWKSVAYNFMLPAFPWVYSVHHSFINHANNALQVTGREMAGIVEQVGKNVFHVRQGDRVWTSTYYRDVRAGAFQRYVIVPQHTVLPIPPNISFEEASCLGVAGLTAAMTLWKWMKVPMPGEVTLEGLPTPPQSPEELWDGYGTPFLSTPLSAWSQENPDEWILIWGGSTITGQFATQLAKLSNLKAITVTSARTASLSKSLGAEHVIVRDGLSPSDIIAEIECVTKGHIAYAIDIVGETTAALVLQALSSDPQRKVLSGRQVPFAPLAFMKSGQEVPDTVQVENVEMKRFILDTESDKYAWEMNRLLEAGQLRLPELEVLDGGLEAIPAALELLRKGDMGGRKLVVRI